MIMNAPFIQIHVTFSHNCSSLPTPLASGCARDIIYGRPLASCKTLLLAPHIFLKWADLRLILENYSPRALCP